jgi:uncharacterized protein (TIGR02246 family)
MSDETEIRELWQEMAQGWGNAEQFTRVFAHDVEFVTVRGEELQGRQAVGVVHAGLFGTVYRDTKLSTEISLVRMVAHNIAVVQVASTIDPAGPRTHAQAVVARREGAWTIVAFHNMIPFVPKGVPA